MLVILRFDLADTGLHAGRRHISSVCVLGVRCAFGSLLVFTARPSVFKPFLLTLVYSDETGPQIQWVRVSARDNVHIRFDCSQHRLSVHV